MGRRKQAVEPLPQPVVIDTIIERYKRRQSWHKAEKALILQTKAILRRLLGSKDAANTAYTKLGRLKVEEISSLATGFFGHNSGEEPPLTAGEMELFNETWPMLLARLTLKENRAAVETELEKLVKQLPIIAWLQEKEQSGIGAGSLAAIIGAAGNLHNYATIQRLWKRMGMAVMPNGRQRRMRDADQAKEHAYSPERRSIMWNVGTSILRTQTMSISKKTGMATREEVGPWRQIYDDRRVYEAMKNENGDYAEQAAVRLAEATFDKKTTAYQAYSSGKLPPLHLHARAQRYMEKLVLRRLLKEWRRSMEKPLVLYQPPSETPDAVEPPPVKRVVRHDRATPENVL